MLVYDVHIFYYFSIYWSDTSLEESMQMFASFSSEQAHFTHGMYVTALILPSDVKKSNRSCSMKERCQRF